jgi:hypothetical protein
MPEAKYDELVRLAKGDEEELREALASDPAANTPEGLRRQTIFRSACADVRFGLSRDAILEAARALNRERCDPPLTDEQVVGQVDGAIGRYPAGTALTRVSDGLRVSESVESVGDSQGETEDDGLTDSALEESVGPESVPPHDPVGVLEVTQVPSQSESIPPGRPFALPISEFIARERPTAEPLLADVDGRAVVGRKSLVLGALGGHGKTTFFVDLALHLAAGIDYPPFTVPPPVSVLMVENEGPEELLAEKLEARLANFSHELKTRLGVCTIDWGGFSLADDQLREVLTREIAQKKYDLVFGDPLDSLGIAGVGSPEDTRHSGSARYARCNGPRSTSTPARSACCGPAQRTGRSSSRSRRRASGPFRCCQRSGSCWFRSPASTASSSLRTTASRCKSGTSGARLTLPNAGRAWTAPRRGSAGTASAIASGHTWRRNSSCHPRPSLGSWVTLTPGSRCGCTPRTLARSPTSPLTCSLGLVRFLVRFERRLLASLVTPTEGNRQGKPISPT